MQLFYEKNGKIISFGLTIGDSFADLKKAVKGCGKFYSRKGFTVNIPFCKISEDLPIVTLSFRLQQDERIDSISLIGSLITPTEADRLYSFLTEMFNKKHYTAEILHRAGEKLLVSTFFNDSFRVSISRYKDFGVKGKDAVTFSAFSATPNKNKDNIAWPATKTPSSNKNNLTIWCIALLAVISIVTAFFLGRLTSKTSDNKINGLYSSDTQTINGSDRNNVYICTGINAKKYHSTPNCRWLDNCSGEIKEVSLFTAEAQGKSPCKGCH